VFNLTQEEVNTDLTIIQGTVIFLNNPMQALIDPGSTHSFISFALVYHLGLELRELDDPR